MYKVLMDNMEIIKLKDGRELEEVGYKDDTCKDTNFAIAAITLRSLVKSFNVTKESIEGMINFDLLLNGELNGEQICVVKCLGSLGICVKGFYEEIEKYLKRKAEDEFKKDHTEQQYEDYIKHFGKAD